MAKRRRRSKKRASREDEPAQPAEAPAPEPRPPREAGPLEAFGPLAAAAAVLVTALLASPAEGTLRFPGLWETGRLLATVAAALAVASTRLEGPTRRLLRGGGLLAGVLALMALYGRPPEWHLSPFAHAHAQGHFAGFPNALPFLALAGAARAALRRPGARLPVAVAALALLWATAVLLVPWWRLNEAHVPVAVGMDLLREDGPALLAGAVLVLALLPVGAAWFDVGRVAWRGGEAAERSRAHHPAALHLATTGALLLAAHHALAPLLLDEAAPGQSAAGLLLAALLLLVALEGAGLLVDLADDPLPEVPRRRVGLTADVAVPATVLVLYGLLKLHALGPSNTDENIYFYMAADVAQHGRWPYVDFFFAHPPLHVLLPALFFWVFGWSLTLAKLFSVVAGAVAGLAVWGVGRRGFGRIGGAFAMVAFLFAAETLKATTNMTGVNLTVMWLALGLWQSLRGHGRVAGVLFGLAACTGFYSMAAICAVLALGLFRGRRFAVEQVVAFVAVWGGINLLFLIVAGDAYVDGVYRYHGMKAFQDERMIPLMGGGKSLPAALVHNLKVMVDGRPFTKDVYYHAHLWTAGLLAPVLGLASWLLRRDRPGPVWRFLDPRRFWRDGPDGVAAIVWCVALALFVQFSMFRELYSFYFTLIYPVLALCLGYVFHRGVRLAWSAVTASWPHRLGAARLATAAVAFGLFSLWEPWAAKANHIFPSEFRDLGERNDYEWTEAPALPGLADAPVRALFWEDHRLKGNMERGYRHYLWNKKRLFASLPDIAAFVREHSEPHETLAGASTSAPLIALASDRRLAANEADTNNKRFRSGLLDEAEYWQQVCADDVRFLVSTSRSYFTPRRMQALPTTRRWFRVAEVFHDPRLKYGRTYPVVILERHGDPPGDGSVCRWEPAN